MCACVLEKLFMCVCASHRRRLRALLAVLLALAELAELAERSQQRRTQLRPSHRWYLSHLATLTQHTSESLYMQRANTLAATQTCHTHFPGRLWLQRTERKRLPENPKYRPRLSFVFFFLFFCLKNGIVWELKQTKRDIFLPLSGACLYKKKTQFRTECVQANGRN